MKRESIITRILVATFAFMSIFIGAGFLGSQDTYARDTWKPCTGSECTNLTIEAVRCDANTYNVTSLDDGFYACYGDLVEGNLESYRVDNNTKINAGDYLIVTLYAEPNASNTNNMTSAGIQFAWDPTVFNIQFGADGVLVDYDFFPIAKKKVGTKWTEYKWSGEPNLVRDGLIVFAPDGEQALDVDSTKTIDEKTPIGFIYVKAADTVEAGGQSSFWVNSENAGQTTLVGSPAGTKIPFSSTDLVINFAGDSKSTDATLSALSVKNGSNNYPLQPAFTSGASVPAAGYWQTYVTQDISSVTIGATATHEKVQKIELKQGTGTYETMATGPAASGSVVSGTGTKYVNDGQNEFTVAVTAENGNTEVYPVKVYRLSDENKLNSLAVSSGGSNISFAEGTFLPTSTTYTINNLPYATKSLNLSAALVDTKGSFSTSGNLTFSGGSATWTLSPDVIAAKTYTQTITVVPEACQAQYKAMNIPGNDCSSNKAKTYTITVNRVAASNDAKLKDIQAIYTSGDSVTNTNKSGTIDGWTVGTTTRTFDLGHVPNSQVAVSLMAEVNDTRAKSIKIGSSVTNMTSSVHSANGSCPLPTVSTKTDCKIEVLAEDGVTKETYTLQFYRNSNVAILSNLSVSSNPAGTFQPTFNKATSTREYFYDYDESALNYAVNATAEAGNIATVELSDGVQNKAAAQGSNSDTYTADGTASKGVVNRTVTVKVVAEDKNYEEYQVKFRRKGSTDSTLKEVKVGTVDLSDQLLDGSNNINLSLTHSVNPDVGVLDVVTAVPTSDFVDRVDIIYNNAEGVERGLAFGTNTIYIDVYPEEGTKTRYTLTVTRRQYNDSAISKIEYKIGGGTKTQISPLLTTTEGDNVIAPESNKISYDTQNITIYPTLTEGKEQRLVGGDCTDTAGCTKQLAVGKNEWTISVQSQDSSSTTSYKIVAWKEGNSDNDIKSLKVKNQYIASLAPTISVPATPPYDEIWTVTVPNSISSLQRSDINIGVDANATIQYHTNSLTGITTLQPGDTGFPSTNNQFAFDVTSQSGDTKRYLLVIQREKNSDGALEHIKIRYAEGASGGTPIGCAADGGKTVVQVGGVDRDKYAYTCTATVPAGTTSYWLSPTAKVPATTMINPASDPEYTMTTDSSDDTQTRQITATAEDGTIYEYNITVTRLLSADATLKEIKWTYTKGDGTVINQELIPDFSSATTLYNLQVSDGSVANVKLDAATTHGNATIDTDLSTAFSLSYDTPTVITINTTAPDGTTHGQYTVNISRPRKTEPRIASITINGTNIENYMGGASFDPDSHEITLTSNFPYSVDTLNFAVTMVDDVAPGGSAKIVGATDARPLQTTIKTTKWNGNNDYTNTVTLMGYAHNTSITHEYKIYIKRDPSNSTLLDTTKPIEVLKNGTWQVALWNSSKGGYEMTVPNSFTTAIGYDGSNASTATVRATVAAPEKTGSESATISYDPNLALKTDDDINGNLNEYHIYVLPESGDESKKATYKLFLTRELSNEAKLTDIVVKDAPGAAGTTNGISWSPSFGQNRNPQEYTVTIPTSLNDVYIEVEKAESHIEVTGDGHVEMKRSSEDVTLFTTSEDGAGHVSYLIHLVREKSHDATLSQLKITNEDGTADYTLIPTFNPEDDTTIYEVTIPGTVDKVKMTPTGSTTLPSGVTQTITQTTPDDATAGTYNIPTNGNRTLTVSVKAEDNTTTKTYKVKITRAPRTDMAIDSFTYIIDSGEVQTLQIVEGVTDYPIPGPMTGGAFDNDGISTIAFSVSLKDPQATVSGDLGVNNVVVGAQTFTITTTAEDTSVKQDYILHVTRWPSHNADLQTLSVSGNKGFSPTWPPQNGETAFTVTMPNSTTSFPDDGVLTVRAASNKASITPDAKLTSLSTTEDNFYNIKVDAEDCDPKYSTIPGVTCTSKTYSLNIVREKNGDNTPGNLEVTDASISPSFTTNGTKYTLTLPYGGTHFGAVATPSAPTTVVSGGGTNLAYADLQNHPTEPDAKYMEISLTAENGETRTLEFKVKVAQSNDKSLSQLYVDDHDLSPSTSTPDILKNTFNYGLPGITKSSPTLVVHAQQNNPDATIRYIYNNTEVCGDVGSCPINLNLSKTAQEIKVEVTPQDDSAPQTYKINFNIELESDAKLADLKIADGNPGLLNPAFSDGRKNYTVLNISNDKSSTTLEFTASDSAATIQVKQNGAVVGSTMVGNGSHTINFGNGKGAISIPVDIVVTAEDGTTQETYTVTVERAAAIASNNANLSSLSVNDQNMKQELDSTKGFEKDVLAYSIGQIDYQTTSLTLRIEPENEEARVYVNGTEATFSGGVANFTVNNLALENGEKTITVRVVAGDTTTSKDYTIKYSKLGGNDATLASLSFNTGTLTPDFSPTVDNYTLNYPDGATPQMTATATDQRANLSFDGRSFGDYKIENYGVTGLTSSSVRKVLTVTAEDGTIKTYNITFAKKSGDDVITSRAYGHEMDSTYVLSVADRDLNHPEDGTGSLTLAVFKTQFDNDPTALKGYDKDGNLMRDTDIVHTGMELRLYKDNSIKDRKKVVIRGDVDGDGLITMNDFSVIQDHYMEEDDYGNDIKIQGEVYQKAADVDVDGLITMNDFSVVQDHYMEEDDQGNPTLIDYAGWLHPVSGG